jgi:hypothetical protein
MEVHLVRAEYFHAYSWYFYPKQEILIKCVSLYLIQDLQVWMGIHFAVILYEIIIVLQIYFFFCASFLDAFEW